MVSENVGEYRLCNCGGDLRCLPVASARCADTLFIESFRNLCERMATRDPGVDYRREVSGALVHIVRPHTGAGFRPLRFNAR